MFILACASLLLPPALPDLDRAASRLTPREQRELGVGTWVPDVTCAGLEGAPLNWRDVAGEKGTVLALTSVTCPVGQKLFPELARTEAWAKQLGFGFVHGRWR